MLAFTTVMLSAALAAAQSVPPPPPQTLTSTMSGVLPVFPPGFTGVETLEGAIVHQAPPNASYVGLAGPAVAQSNLPAATYTATFPSADFDELAGSSIGGTVMASSTQGGSGVMFTMNLKDLPSESQYGPFIYHIHNMPVPADGNCTSTLGHFDPTNVGEYYMCDTSKPENCQAGDLAGKHGKIMTAPTFSMTFTEMYLSTDPSSPYFFGDKSIVIHSSNTTRLACANFMQSGSSSSSSNSSSSSGSSSGGSSGAATTGSSGSSGSMATSSMSTPPVATGAANKVIAEGALMGLGALAAFFF